MRPAVLAVTVLWAVALIGLGAPATIGSVLKTPSFSVVAAAHRGEYPEPRRLDIARSSLDAAASWDRGAQVRTDLGLLLTLRIADPELAPAERQELAVAAGDALFDGITRAPARPHAWARLATVRTLESGASLDAAALLRRSLEVGRYVDDVVPARVEMLLRNWQEVPTDLRIVATEQIRRAWEADPNGLAAIALRTGQAHIVRFALRDLEGAPAQFDQALRYVGG